MTKCVVIITSIMLGLGIQIGIGKPGEKLAALFATQDLLEIEIKTDLTSFLADRGEDPEYHRAYARYVQNDDAVAFKIKIKSRGNFRKRVSNCEFPPIRVRISDKQGEGTLFEGIRNLKLVTHCQGEELVLREYLVYKLYNLLTDQSFNVRLARIRYVDTGNKYEATESFGFFIEDDDDLAARLGGTLMEKLHLTRDSIDYDQMGMLAMFQYMVGNLDWNITLEKNVKLVSLQNKRLPIAVPYDFDFSRFVNASYTGLEEDFVCRDLKGLCRTEAEWAALFDKFKAIEPEAKELLLKFPYLKKSVGREMYQYTSEFFKQIDNPKNIRKLFLESCNG